MNNNFSEQSWPLPKQDQLDLTKKPVESVRDSGSDVPTTIQKPKKQKKPDVLKAIFGNNPCAFVSTFAEAVSIAERLPEGCRIVWLWTEPRYSDGEHDHYRLCRHPEMAMQDVEDNPRSFIRTAWHDGKIIIPESEHKDRIRCECMEVEATPISSPVEPAPEIKTSPSENRPKFKKPVAQEQSVGSGVSIPALIESLKAVGLDAETILKIIADSSR